MINFPKIEIPALRADGTTQRIVVPAVERASVLIVDDSPAKLVALAAIVSGLELEIVTATSGEQALRQLLKRDFAVILLDVNMPTMDGFETATLIRSRPRSVHTPIIFVTAGANSESDRFRGYTLGAVDFINSPIIIEFLRAKVRVFVDLTRRPRKSGSRSRSFATRISSSKPPTGSWRRSATRCLTTCARRSGTLTALSALCSRTMASGWASGAKRTWSGCLPRAGACRSSSTTCCTYRASPAPSWRAS